MPKKSTTLMFLKLFYKKLHILLWRILDKIIIWRFGEFVGNDDDNFGVFEDNETDMFKRENNLG